MNESLANALKSKPSPIYNQNFASRISTGNLTDDISKIASADWIIEVVVERLDIKNRFLNKLKSTENQEH